MPPGMPVTVAVQVTRKFWAPPRGARHLGADRAAAGWLPRGAGAMSAQ